MLPVTATLIGALCAGVIIAALALRWPVISAPRVDPRTIVDEAAEHPSVARMLWRRIDATRVSQFALGIVLVVLGSGAVLLGLLVWMIRANAGIARYDRSAARWGAAHATTTATNVMRDISLVGGTVGSIAIALVVAAIASRRLRARSVVAFLATVMVGQNILFNVIKFVVDRTRPNIDRLTGFSGSSFPSGHATTTAATLAACALLLGYGRGPIARAALTGIAGGIAVAVAESRVFLGVHWVTDVIAGLVLGWTWFAVVSIAFGGRLVRFAEPVEAAERVVETVGTAPPPAH
jgi:membrane-associated phospholipid phosphatase